MLCLVSRRKATKCGSVGTGRRARLRILWLLQSCGFKSHLPHEIIKRARSLTWPFLLSHAEESLEPMGSRSPRHFMPRRSAQTRGPPDLVRPIFRIAASLKPMGSRSPRRKASSSGLRFATVGSKPTSTGLCEPVRTRKGPPDLFSRRPHPIFRGVLHLVGFPLRFFMLIRDFSVFSVDDSQID